MSNRHKTPATKLRANADYYRRNKVKVLQQKYIRRNEVRLNICTYLSVHPCVDCGESDLVTLHFDHVRGSKKATIEYMVSGGTPWASILDEIDKCEVRCANCHLKRHAIECGSYKYRYQQAGQVHVRSKYAASQASP